MSKTSNIFRFRKNSTIGALSAELDADFLAECFVDIGLIESLARMSDHRRVILGRTGSGKTALFIQLEKVVETLIVNPDELALDHLSNSALLQQLDSCGISLMPLYKLLWKHVFVVEILRARHEQLRDGDKAPSFWSNLLGKFSTSASDQSNKQALEYLSEFGEHFWQTTEYRIKEVTERFEQKINAKIGAKLGSANFAVGGTQGESTEQKAAVEQVGREFVEAIQIRKLSDAVKWLATDIDGKPPLLIIVDGLDKEWAETRLKLQLIRALIDTSQELKAVPNVKVLIALRADLFESVLASVTDAGFQREKYTQLCMPIAWTRDELKKVVETRVNKLVKDAYTGALVKLDDIIEPIGGAQGIQYMLDRTLLRPRDIIEFFNLCIEQASDNPKITRQMILTAEAKYSAGRLTAVADEWRGIEPLIAECAQLLRGKKATFELKDLADADIHTICERFFIDHYQKKSRFLDVARRHAEGHADASATQVRIGLLKLFYKIGLVGVKPSAQEKYMWCHDGAPTLDGLDLDDNCNVRVQKTFRRSLNINEGGPGNRD